MIRVEYFGHTDIGLKRESNEDHYLCVDLRRDVPGLIDPLFLFIVADGIGGHTGGAVASALAAETLRTSVALRLAERPGRSDFPGMLERASQEANDRIFQRIDEDKRLAGMGTTLVVALLADHRAFLANIGDSRAYLIRKEAMTQISLDHSWAAEQKRMSVLSEDEIRRSPFKHMITRSLGYESTARMDYFEEVLKEDDYLLLCTDGLYGALSDKSILKVFKKSKEPESICRRLLKSANHSGSRDNITAIVVHIAELAKKKPRPLSATVRLDDVLRTQAAKEERRKDKRSEA